MADISFDCSASNLLCTETNLWFDALDSVTTHDQTHQTNNQNLGFVSDRSEPLIGLPLLSEESFYLMIERERQHLPRDDYLKRLRSGGLDLGVRREALDWIWKVCWLVFSNGLLIFALKWVFLVCIGLHWFFYDFGEIVLGFHNWVLEISAHFW